MAIWAHLLFALAAGAMIPFQAGINAQLASWVGSPMRAAFVSFAVGTAALFVLTLAFARGWPGAEKVGDAPAWVWIGGLLGAFYVFGSIVTAPRLGAVTFIALVLAGQAVASLLVDHFGWVGFEQHSLSAGRLAGIALVGVGVALIRIF